MEEKPEEEKDKTTKENIEKEKTKNESQNKEVEEEEEEIEEEIEVEEEEEEEEAEKIESKEKPKDNNNTINENNTENNNNNENTNNNDDEHINENENENDNDNDTENIPHNENENYHDNDNDNDNENIHNNENDNYNNNENIPNSENFNVFDNDHIHNDENAHNFDNDNINDNENDNDNDSNNFSFRSPKGDIKVKEVEEKNEEEASDSYKNNLKIDSIYFENNLKRNNKENRIYDYNNMPNNLYDYNNNINDDKERNENAPDSMIENENTDKMEQNKNIEERNNKNIDNNSIKNDNKKEDINNNNNQINNENEKENVEESDYEEEVEKEEENENSQSPKVYVPSKEELIEEKKLIKNEENIENKESEENINEKNKEEEKQNEEDIKSEKLEKSKNENNNEKSNNNENINTNIPEKVINNDEETNNKTKKAEVSKIKEEEKNEFINIDDNINKIIETNGQNSEEYKDYSNEEKENEEKEEEEEEIEEEVEEEYEQKDEKHDENNNLKDRNEIEKREKNNNYNSIGLESKNDEETPDGEGDYANYMRNNIESYIRETPSRRKINSPHASPIFNVYGNDFNTPLPLSSKNDVEAIIEKPKEDEEKEEDEINNEKDNNKIKNNINKNDINNEDNHKLIYTHLNPQIIDNTKTGDEELDNENNFNSNKMKKKNIVEISDKKAQNNKNKEIEEEEEEEEIEEEEEEEEDDDEEEVEERADKDKKMNKKIETKRIIINNETKINNKKKNEKDENNKNEDKDIIDQLPIKISQNAIYKVEDNKNNNQINQKIIEYENKNQYVYPNVQIFKNNFTYIKKNTSGNTSFRSFNKSLKNKVNISNSLNNNQINSMSTQQHLLNDSGRKIIGIYSKPNNYIENIERESKDEKVKESQVEENDKTPKYVESNNIIEKKIKLNSNNLNNLGNEYLYKYSGKKREEIAENEENDEYEDYEGSSENEQKNNQFSKDNIVYNRKIFLTKKDKPNNINNNDNFINKNENMITPKGDNYKRYGLYKNIINTNNDEHEEEEEESEEESYDLEESEEEEDENKEEEEDYSKQEEIVEEKRQFKKKDKQKQYTEHNRNKNNKIGISDEENESKNDSEKESIKTSQEDEAGVEPENENDEIYILELENTGLPNLKYNEILICNINSLINISIPKGKEISNEVSLITNCENDFPDPFYLNKMIEENNKNNDKDFYKNSIININLYNPSENNQIKKSLKPYQIYPNKIDSKIYFRIKCKRAGNISFTLMYKDSTQNNKIKFTKPFYILVNPIVNVKNNNPIEVNQIQMQSILSHKIGTLSTNFEKYYEEASLLGYNFIHFRNLQKLTKEENIYLIKDHNELNDNLFKENNRLRKNQKTQQLSTIIQNLNKKYKVGAITDVILYQTSNESEWILEHSDCTYNLDNTPWLNVSYELDKILVNYSDSFYNRKVRCKSAPYINNINDVNEIIKELYGEINKSKLEEFFYISLEKHFVQFKNYYPNILKNLKNKNFITKISVLINELKNSFRNMNNIKNIINNKRNISEIILKVCKNYGYKRFGVEMNIEFVSLLIISLYHFEKKGIPTEYYFLKEIKKYIETINNIWKEKINELLSISILNIKEYLRYKYLQLKNKNKIKNLIESYFYVHKENDLNKIFLCNGWVMNSEDKDNLFPDVTKYGNWYLLKRKYIVFKNSIKINYGSNIENSSNYLINYMTKYISNLAMIFDGLYIDSIQYLPIFVLKYFIDIARKINPSIILLADISEEEKKELNSINFKKEKNNINQIEMIKKKYVEELGINLFIYDFVWNNDSNTLINNIIRGSSNYNNNIYSEQRSHFNTNLYSPTIIEDNQIYLGKFKCLKPKIPMNIIYNINSDNMFYYDKLKSLSINLTTMSLAGLLDTSIGSVYEFDKFSPSILSNLKNKKKYKFNIDELKNLMQKVKNTKYLNEKTFEVFFEFHPNVKNYKNIKYINNVKLALNFHDWQPDVELTKIKDNLFMTKIRLPKGKYYYKYVINDEIWCYDETQPIEKDNNDNINNVIDLRNHNKVIVPNLLLFRQELNNIKSFFKNKNSEIYIQKNTDLISIIRVIADYNSLINKSIEDHDILSCKNKILFYEEKKNNLENKNYNFSENDSDDDDNFNNNDRIIKKEINFKFNFKNKLSRSLDKKNNDGDLSESSGDIKVNNIKKILGSPNNKKSNNYASPFKERERANTITLFKSNSSLLEASMDVNLGNSSSNMNQNTSNNLKIFSSDNNSMEFNDDNNKSINNDMGYYDGYAVICFPSYNNNQLGKGVVKIPGKITDLICACHISEDNSYIISKKNDVNKKELYFTKNLNHLKNIISDISYYNNKTMIQFINIPNNIGIIIKFRLGENNKNIINNLNQNLEMLFNKGIEFINYFDLNDINKLLFESSNKKDIYEINIELFNDNNINSMQRKNKIKFRYAGLNQLIEIIKMIKKTENLNIFDNKYEDLNENQKFIISLYKDITQSDGLINYILARLNETKSFKLMHEFLKKLILTDYKSLPNFIKPVYFEKIIISLHHAIMSFSLKE